MEQWAEETSLRLLELMASTILALSPDSQAVSPSAGSAEGSAADGREPKGSRPSMAEQLAALADADARFMQWLRLRWHSDVDSTSPATELDWNRVADRWLEWLAAEKDAPEATGESAEELEPSAERACARSSTSGALFGRALIANAQAALEARKWLAERECSRRMLARELAYDMAYGLSHELNNPLANVATRARLLAEEEPNERKRQLLAAIVDQAMRGCEMIADLMLIARPPATDVQPVDLAPIVCDIVTQARPWGEARGLSFTLLTPEHAVIVRTDPTAISEALWAILRNAIEVARSEIAITLSIASAGASAGGPGRAIVAIQDDGPGITPHAQLHAFNPFFSGREAGRGLGTGLSKAERVASLAGGSVSINNGPLGGCVTTLAIPLHVDSLLD